MLAFVALEHAVRMYRLGLSSEHGNWEVIMDSGESTELGSISGTSLLEKIIK